MPVKIAEANTLTRHTAKEANSSTGLWRIRVIDAGMGSSGFYPATTLEAAARNKVFPKGTQMFLDHATDQESWEKPEGSLERLVGVLASDGEWNPAANAIEADVKVYSHWRPLLAEMADDIGVSIRAAGTAEVQDMQGTPVPVITELVEAVSVDFVTKAGRGGRVLKVAESARRTTEAARLAETTAAPTAAGSEPTTTPATSGGTTTTSKESTVEITKDEYDRLTAAANRVPALESERDTATAKATDLEQQLAARNAEVTESNRKAARAEIAKAVSESKLPQLAQDRIVKKFADAEAFDAAAVEAAVVEERDYITTVAESFKTPATTLGNGPATVVTESTTTSHSRSAWGREIKEA